MSTNIKSKMAILTVLSAARRLARYCEKGDIIDFDNEFDEADGKEINLALEYLRMRALDTANVVTDGNALQEFFR